VLLGTRSCLIDLIVEFDAVARTVIASFDSPTIDHVRAELPGAVTSPGVQELLAWSQGTGDLAGHAMVQVPPFFGDIEVVTAEFVADMHELGLAVWVWMDSKVQEDADFYSELIDLGVDGLLVSRPAAGIAEGYADGTYRSTHAVTRQAGARWLHRTQLAVLDPAD
jgi:glycerophosphoryl diester phosphodiesterase